MLERRATDGQTDASSLLPANPAPASPTRPLPGSPIAKAHADFVMAVATAKPHAFALSPEPEDFTARAILCEALLDRVKLHLSALVEEAAENDSTLIIREAGLTQTIDAHLGDLAGDITGTLEQAAERLREERYDGCPRGPFFRRR
jgi:hypothetical protein